MSGLGRQLLDSDAATAEREALGFDATIFGAAGVPAPIFQALVPRRVGVYDPDPNTFGVGGGGLSFARASTALYRDNAGTWQEAQANVIRPDHDSNGSFLGFLFEPAATNVFLNSGVAVTQDISLATGEHTISVHGAGSVTSSDATGTASGHGVAVDAAPITIAVSGAGTFTFTVAGSPTYVQVETGKIATSPIVTGAGSASRTIDIGTYPTPSGISDANGMVMIDFTPGYSKADLALNTLTNIVKADATLRFLFHWLTAGGASRFALRDDAATTASVSIPAGLVRGTRYRIAGRWDAAAAVMEVAYKAAGTWVTASGSGYSGALPNDGTMRMLLATIVPVHISRFSIWNRSLSISEITRLF